MSITELAQASSPFAVGGSGPARWRALRGSTAFGMNRTGTTNGFDSRTYSRPKDLHSIAARRQLCENVTRFPAARRWSFGPGKFPDPLKKGETQ